MALALRAAVLILVVSRAGAEEPVRLEPGAAVAREMKKAGEVHRYAVTLGDGEYFQAVIAQGGAEVQATVTGPGGQVALVADGPGAVDNGLEPLALVAAAGGPYEVAVEALGRIVPPGRYELRVEAVRPPTETDLLRVRAVRVTNEACRLLEGSKPDAPQAIEKLRQARADWEALGEGRIQMWVENHLGYAHSGFLDRLDDAHSLYGRALETARRLGDDFGEAYILVNMAEVLRRQGRLEEAGPLLVRARALYQASGRQLREARVLLVLGAMASGAGDLQQSLDHVHEALRRYEEGGDSVGEASARLNLGNSYLRLGEYELAIAQYLLAHAGYAQDPRNQAFLAGQIGMARFRQGDYPGARAALEEARAAFRTMGNRPREASTLAKLGVLDREEGKLDAARDELAAAAAVLEEAGDPLGAASAYCELGETQRQRGEGPAAQAAFEAAARLSPEWHAVLRPCVEQGLAAVARDRGELDRARQHAERAVEIDESVRASVASQESRASTLASSQALYALLIDVRMRQHDRAPTAGHDAGAFEASERARARSLLELLAERGLDVREGVDPALLAEERSLRQRLNVQAQAREQAAGAGRREPAEVLGRQVADLTAQLRALEARIRRASPRYAALTQPQPLTLAEVRAQALDPDTALLAYALGEAGGHLWVVTTDGLASHRLPGRGEIERAARRAYEAAAVPAVGRGSGLAWADAARELARLVLPPDLGRLTAKRLLVVAPGALQYVPFAALPLPSDPAAATLVERFEVVSAPSASVVATLRQEHALRRPPSKAVAVLADPVFDASDPRVHPARRTPAASVAAVFPRSDRALRSAAAAGGRSMLSRLPFTRLEAEAIVARVAPGASLRALGFAASRATATSSALADYRIVHFATHGVFNARQPELSGLVLSLVDAQGRKQDGFLGLPEVYNLRLGAELVVLSGCQTALGKDLRGEGLQGLTRGFMYAGSPRVVASLWQVDDLATAELMKRFYRSMLVDKLPPSAALRAAQRELSAIPRWRAPYYWAAFVLQGDWR